MEKPCLGCLECFCIAIWKDYWSMIITCVHKSAENSIYPSSTRNVISGIYRTIYFIIKFDPKDEKHIRRLASTPMDSSLLGWKNKNKTVAPQYGNHVKWCHNIARNLPACFLISSREGPRAEHIRQPPQLGYFWAVCSQPVSCLPWATLSPLVNLGCS